MPSPNEPLSALKQYSLGYQDLFFDRRLFKGFQVTLSGILSSGSTFSAATGAALVLPSKVQTETMRRTGPIGLCWRSR